MLHMRPIAPIIAFIAPLLTVVGQVDTLTVRTFQRHTVEVRPHQVDSPATHTGDVRLTVDPRVERMMQDYATHRQVQFGYRVQIYLGDRRTAEETKRSFLQKYPDMPAYLSWLAPNFRLRVGDMRTRLEAEKLLNELKPLYPGSYIVKDEIEMPQVVQR